MSDIAFIIIIIVIIGKLATLTKIFIFLIVLIGKNFGFFI